MRLDRWLTLWVFRRIARKRPGCVPVLMYHSISDDAETGVPPYYRVATSPRRFAEHLDWLAAGGYRGVSLEAAVEALTSDPPPPQPLVAITFDDGFRDFHTQAGSALRKHGFTATMYLPTAFIADQRRSFQGRECLTWDEVRELRALGIRFGSHTVNHPKLYELTWDKIETELRCSKQRIEDELREEIGSFAYPYAFPQEDVSFGQKLRELMNRCGYRSCVTTIIGRAQPGDDPLRLRRLPANSCDDHALFRAKLGGAYDWLGGAQGLIRRMRAGFKPATAACEPRNR